jgi:solute carrier family 25 (mitochondrial folate transporter), member 32
LLVDCHLSQYYCLSCRVATTVTYPLQLIKTRIQQRTDAVELTDDGKVEVVKRRDYNSIRSSSLRIWRLEGIGGFFKGCIPNAIRVMPGAAITFVVYEEVTDFLS